MFNIMRILYIAVAPQEAHLHDHLADLVFDNDRLLWFDNESAGRYIDLVLDFHERRACGLEFHMSD